MTSILQQTLHEAVSTKFDKTPQGTMFTKDIKTIFSLTIICLNLSKTNQKVSKLSFLSKSYPFSFTVQDAIDVMSNLSSTIESSATKTTISYAIKKDMALSLLKKFMVAKLLHTPADRTRYEPKDKVLLQPTPKGVALIQKYIKQYGFRNLDQVPIIHTNFNSMDLFIFERTSVSDSIVYSEYFIHLLFDKFLGPSRNVWRPTNTPDKLPSLDHRLEIDDEFDFSNFQNESFKLPRFYKTQYTDSASLNRNHNYPVGSSINKSTNNISKSDEVSPFAHTFFTNPESDSHVQYYVSNKGVRLHEDYKFGSNGSSIIIKYCFNAKAAWQWLMDCTDAMYPHEATMVLNLFYKYELIEPIILPPSTSTSKRNFSPLKTSFYTISKKGLEISHWDHNVKRKFNIANEQDIIEDASALTLSNRALTSPTGDSDFDESSSNQAINVDQLDIYKVLADPGMRYLFREHLSKEHCAENLDAYIDIGKFIKKMVILKNILDSYYQQQDVTLDSSVIKPPSKTNLIKLINECLSSVYNIYSSYISVGSPSQINIDHTLREHISDTMLQPTSPLKSTFDMIKPPEPAYIKNVTATLDPYALSNSPISATSPISKLKNKDISIHITEALTNDYLLPNDIPKTPRENEIKESTEVLNKLFPLMDLVSKQVLKVLEYDSFAKFIKSETLFAANIN